MEDTSPNLDCCELRIIQLVAKKELKDKDWEHQDELWSVSELAVQDLVSHHNDFVEDNK